VILLLGALLVGVDLPCAPASQAPVFSTRVEAVRVDVLVTRGGRPIRDLRPQDFEVFDNGVPQPLDFASFETIPLNVVLALDMSSSVAGERLDHLRHAGGALLDVLKPEDQAGLVTFGHMVAVRSELTADRARVRSALDHADASGYTALVDACYAALSLGESGVGRALVIVFSDGVDTTSWLTAEQALRAARRTDAVVYAVSVRGAATADFLRELSEATGGDVLEVESIKDVGATFVAILAEFRHRYLLSYSPQGVAKDGWHRLEVRVKTKGASVKARPGYLAGS
jgi:Ca-activated chloride channel family protein